MAKKHGTCVGKNCFTHKTNAKALTVDKEGSRKALCPVGVMLPSPLSGVGTQENG